jgi:hypothetical protein
MPMRCGPNSTPRGTFDLALLSQGMVVARIAGATEVVSLLDAAGIRAAAASGSTQHFDKDEYIARVRAAIEPVGDYGRDELVSDREIDGSVELTVTPDLEVECAQLELEAACIQAVQLGLRSVQLWDEALTVSLSERPELEYVNSTEDQVSRETRFRFAFWRRVRPCGAPLRTSTSSASSKMPMKTSGR